MRKHDLKTKGMNAALIGMLILLAGCGAANTSAVSTKSSAALRELTADERAADFDQLLQAFKTYYGPYSYKEKLLGINIAQVAADLKAKAIAAKSDEEFQGYVFQLGAALKDGHVQISSENTQSGTASYSLPIGLVPAEGRVLVSDLTPDFKKAYEINIGDEILEVDNKPIQSYLPLIKKYKQWAKDSSNEHLINYVFNRRSVMTELKPTKAEVRVKVMTAEGVKTFDIPWVVKQYNPATSTVLAPSADAGSSKLAWGGVKRLDLSVPFDNDGYGGLEASLLQMGQTDPVFVTPTTQAIFKFVKVYPSEAVRAKYGLAAKETPAIYAALYRAAGKTILLVRQATYSPSDYPAGKYLAAYAALFEEYQALADVLVLDQTHNPGGSYCGLFYGLFARQGDLSAAEKLHADRKWINDLKINRTVLNPEGVNSWDARTLLAWGGLVEKAYDAGQELSEAIPLFTGSLYAEPIGKPWSKPMLVLIDELAGSCGDMFPMLVKANGRAKLFGQGTMGLGGNVEEVAILPNSRMHIKMTRGLFFPYHSEREPLAEEYIENNGVAADIPYPHTVKDVRSGYAPYVLEFTKAALAQIPSED